MDVWEANMKSANIEKIGFSRACVCCDKVTEKEKITEDHLECKTLLRTV